MEEMEKRLLSELMKSSRRSDKELARAIGTTRPKIARLRRKLEKEGFIKEYTMIPDFAKLGYQILAITFVALNKMLGSEEEVEKARKLARKTLVKSTLEGIVLERGTGLGYDGVIISYHTDFKEHSKYLARLKQYTFLDGTKVDSFLIALSDEVHFRPLTLSTLAKHLLTINAGR